MFGRILLVNTTETAIKYGRPKARKKERAADVLDEFVTNPT
jgi:hypothetical protein